jgi:putative MATE family efflux protein
MAKDLTIGNETKQVFFFALPLLAGNIFQQLYTVVNSIIVGRFLGKQALAAVGASFPIIYMLISLVVGVTMGSTIVIAQAYGSHNYERVTKAISTMYIFLFFSAILIASAGIYFADDIFRLMQLPSDIIPQATTYMRVYFLGLAAFFGYNGVSAFLRGLGDSKTPLYFLLLSNIANIFFDLLFILVFKWGIAGAALSTIVSQTGAFVTAVLWLNRHNKFVKFTPRLMKFDYPVFMQSISIGLPSGLQQTFVGMGMMALVGIVSGFGTNVMAAYTAAGRIEGLATMPAMNFSMAISTFVGQNIGAKRIDRVIRGFKSILLISLGFTLFISLFIMLFGTSLMKWFTADAEVIRLGYHYLLITSSFYALFSIMFVINGLLRGAGDTLIPMFVTLISLWVVRIPLAKLFSSFWGVSGIWWAIPVGWTVGLILSFSYFKTGRWKCKHLD